MFRTSGPSSTSLLLGLQRGLRVILKSSSLFLLVLSSECLERRLAMEVRRRCHKQSNRYFWPMDCLIVLACIQDKSLRIKASPLAIMSPLLRALSIKDGNLELISPICIVISRPEREDYKKSISPPFGYLAERFRLWFLLLGEKEVLTMGVVIWHKLLCCGGGLETEKVSFPVLSTGCWLALVEYSRLVEIK